MASRTLPQRLWRWGLTGGICTVFQYLVLRWLVLCLTHFWAAWLAYVAGGQLNFVLSSTFTWRDRHTDLHGKRLAGTVAHRWCKYTALNLGMGIVNTLIQVGCHRFGLPLGIAFVAGNIITPFINYTAQHFFVFRHDEPPNEFEKGD